jgi:hypothetical protein
VPFGARDSTFLRSVGYGRRFELMRGPLVFGSVMVVLSCDFFEVFLVLKFLCFESCFFRLKILNAFSSLL